MVDKRIIITLQNVMNKKKKQTMDDIFQWKMKDYNHSIAFVSVFFGYMVRESVGRKIGRKNCIETKETVFPREPKNNSSRSMYLSLPM